MDSEILKILSEELRETRIMVVETRRMADAAQKTAEAAMKHADAAMSNADAAMKHANASWSKAESGWELVIMTRNQIQEDLQKLKLPWWRKFLGNIA